MMLLNADSYGVRFELKRDQLEAVFGTGLRANASSATRPPLRAASRRWKPTSELTVETGLILERRAPTSFTLIAGNGNGRIYQLPTEEQLGKIGYAQEDCDCLVAQEWQKLSEMQAREILNKF